jgi:hypothetical protein
MPERELVLWRCQSKSWSCRDAKSVVFVSVVRIEDVVVVVSDVVVGLGDVVVVVRVVKSGMRSPKLFFAARNAGLK